jgi:hypothetical protein
MAGSTLNRHVEVSPRNLFEGRADSEEPDHSSKTSARSCCRGLLVSSRSQTSFELNPADLRYVLPIPADFYLQPPRNESGRGGAGRSPSVNPPGLCGGNMEDRVFNARAPVRVPRLWNITVLTKSRRGPVCRATGTSRKQRSIKGSQRTAAAHPASIPTPIAP